MNVIKGFIIAFSMFSKIPMPMVKWEEKNMKYMFCFFPFIGIVSGLINIVLYMVCDNFHINEFMFGAVSAIIPVAVTGGIHFDGFMDTCDALSSHKDKEKMLEILDDSRVGAFAVISTVIYFLLYFGAMTCVRNLWQVQMIMMVFFSARAIAVCILLVEKSSKESGLLYTFKTGTNKIITGLFMAVYIMMSVGIIESFNILIGALTVIAMILISVFFVKFICKKFGGVSGDLIGYFICICELTGVIITTIGGCLL